MSVNVQAFEALAVASQNDDLSKFNALPTNLQTAVKAAQEEAMKEASKSAANEIISLLKARQARTDKLVAQIRDLERQSKDLRAMIDDQIRAEAYGLSTNNFLPLVAEVQGLHTIPAGLREKAKVPKTFVAGEDAATDTTQPA